MNSEQLRETIIRATIPLIAKNQTLTTAQIAQAAGIDEADVLSVFENPSAILRASTETVKAAVLAALNPAAVLQDLQAIPLQQTLAARLADAIRALDSYRHRIATSLDPLNSASPQRHQTGSADNTADETHYEEIDTRSVSTGATRTDVIREGIARLLEPDQAHLRLPVRFLAGAFLGMYADCRPASDQDPSQLHAEQPQAEQLVELFLHGALV